MRLIIDIDGTLLFSKCENYKYYDTIPNKKEIKLLNKVYCTDNTIILHTSRHWNQYEFTKKQLKKFGIKYHELVMGKPEGIDNHWKDKSHQKDWLQTGS